MSIQKQDVVRLFTSPTELRSWARELEVLVRSAPPAGRSVVVSVVSGNGVQLEICADQERIDWQAGKFTDVAELKVKPLLVLGRSAKQFEQWCCTLRLDDGRPARFVRGIDDLRGLRFATNDLVMLSGWAHNESYDAQFWDELRHNSRE